MKPSKQDEFVLNGISMPKVVEGHALIKCEGGWSHVKIMVHRDGRVILENSQPDMKAIVFEAFKIAQVKTMNKLEG